MFSIMFIKRPILATVCSIIIVIAGIVSIYTLPIAQFPELVPPQVTVSAQYPGATPEVIAQVVAAPLETQINGVDDMIYMNSVSNGQGNMTLTVTFELGTDSDQATINVNNRVQMATPSIPAEVRQYGIIVQKSSPNILLIFSLFSPQGIYDTTYISNYALLNVVDGLKRIPGVSDVNIFTNQDYAMRIWLRPDKMSQLGIAPADVAAAVKDQNSQYALGRFGDAPTKADLQKTYIMTTTGRLTTEEEFENIIIKSLPGGETVYLKDIARVQLGAKSYSFSGTQNGTPAVPVGVTLAPGANAIQVCDEVKAQLAEAQKKFPSGLVYDIPLRHDYLCPCLDRRGHRNPHRGVGPGLSCRAAIFTGFPRHDHSLPRRSRLYNRDVCGIKGLWVFDQHADALWYRSGDRARCRRRDRRH